MKILFCNIAYMNYYEGNLDKDILPMGAGKYVKENDDAHEKWNFLNVDGKCYGYVQNPGTFHIERLEKVGSTVESVDDVTIIWCAPKEKNKTVIIGWYEHATLYRYIQEAWVTPISGIERWYYMSADADNSYLLPVEDRNFEIKRASKAGTGKGFGQENFWYAESEYARNELIPQVIEFISSKKENRINKTKSAFETPENVNDELSKDEIALMNQYLENEEYDLYLPLGYRYFYTKKNADAAYNMAVAFAELEQYSKACEWYEKVMELEGESWEVMGKITYLYQQIGAYDKSISYAKSLMKFPECKVSKTIDEINCIIADDYFRSGDIKTAIDYLDEIINTSSDKELIAFTKDNKKEWESFL